MNYKRFKAVLQQGCDKDAFPMDITLDSGDAVRILELERIDPVPDDRPPPVIEYGSDGWAEIPEVDGGRSTRVLDEAISHYTDRHLDNPGDKFALAMLNYLPVGVVCQMSDDRWNGYDDQQFINANAAENELTNQLILFGGAGRVQTMVETASSIRDAIGSNPPVKSPGEYHSKLGFTTCYQPMKRYVAATRHSHPSAVSPNVMTRIAVYSRLVSGGDNSSAPFDALISATIDWCEHYQRVPNNFGGDHGF